MPSNLHIHLETTSYTVDSFFFPKISTDEVGSSLFFIFKVLKACKFLNWCIRISKVLFLLILILCINIVYIGCKVIPSW